MSFQLGLSNCQPRSGKDHALGPHVEPHGVHCRKGLACVTFPCQLCDSATHFHSDIFRVKLCVAEISFPCLMVLPICGVIKLCALESGRRRYTVGEKLGACVDGRNLGFMLCTGDPQSSTLLQKGGWELNSNTQTTSAIGYKPDWKSHTKMKVVVF